jgi:hypothetical protein
MVKEGIQKNNFKNKPQAPYNKEDNKGEGNTLKDTLKKDRSIRKKDNKGEGGHKSLKLRQHSL